MDKLNTAANKWEKQMEYLNDHCVLAHFIGYIFDVNGFYETLYDASSMRNLTKTLPESPLIWKNGGENFSKIIKFTDYNDMYGRLMSATANKSYLLSVLVGKKYAASVMQGLKDLAKQITALDYCSNWYGKIIETACPPFKIIGILITNSLMPQVIGIGTSLINAIKDSNEDIWRFEDAKLARHWYNALSIITYVYQPVDISQLYQKQLISLNATPERVIAVSQDLAKITQEYIDQAKDGLINYDYDQSNERMPAIVGFPLDLVYMLYQTKHTKGIAIKPGEKANNDPEFTELINYLAKQISD